jgi:hypothetical protein
MSYKFDDTVLTHCIFHHLQAFENSNCKDYVTEKFFVNGLTRNILPIVVCVSIVVTQNSILIL